VQLLLEHGADPGIRDDEGLTPAMLAARSKRVTETNLKPVVDCLNGIEPLTAE
jgi:ankyrin repeat protein